MADLKKLTKQVKDKLYRKYLDVNLFLTHMKRKAANTAAGPNGKPAVWIDLSGNSYVRFSYITAKYLQIEGYQVFYKPNVKFMLSLGAPYARLLIHENEVVFSNEIPKNAVAVFSDHQSGRLGCKSISNDYFSTIFEHRKRSYHIPIGMHPNMYMKGLWNAPVSIAERKRSIFFAGNFNAAVYKRLSRNKKFAMVDRVEIGRMLGTLPNCTFPKSYDELINNHADGKIDIVQQANFKVPMEVLRPTIARYAFFIACPGVDMPLSHNLIEAMSVGAIPIIHQEYSDMLAPQLQDMTNALIYNNDNFMEVIQKALRLDAAQIKEMAVQVTSYYDLHLTPKGIVEKLVSPDYDEYFLNAERTSVGIMKKST
jgi:uncharacterized Zn-finger protein